MSKKNKKRISAKSDETYEFSNIILENKNTIIEENNKPSNDIDDMINEKRRNTSELTEELEKAKNEYNRNLKEETHIQKIKAKKDLDDELEESLAKTQILELTRQMKFNFEDVKEENNNKKNGVTLINIIGIINLICIGFYIYLLTFTNYQDNRNNYLMAGAIIILLVIFFGLSVITGKKVRKIFNIFNIITILGFITFNIITLIY